MATVREQRPKPDRSWMAATRGVSMAGDLISSRKDIFYCIAEVSVVQGRRICYTAFVRNDADGKSEYAPVMELVDMRDLGDVISVRV